MCSSDLLGGAAGRLVRHGVLHDRGLRALAADDALAESQAEQGARLTEEVARDRAEAAARAAP